MTEPTNTTAPAKEENEKPRTLKIKVEDAQTGEVFADYETDIAIIGAVQGTRATADPEKENPTHVFYIGNQGQLAQMLFYIANEIGKNMAVQFEAIAKKKKDPNAPVN